MSISGLALSRVSHQAFGALEAACVHVRVHMYFSDISEFLPLSLCLSPYTYLRHTHANAHTCLPGGCRSVTA